jgi:hypothetical protein
MYTGKYVMVAPAALKMHRNDQVVVYIVNYLVVGRPVFVMVAYGTQR